MPELPEVEVTRRSFVDQIAGAQIVSLRMGKPLRWPLGCAAEALVGRRVQGVRRRGKYLLLDLDQGLLLLHLGMSGSLIFLPSPPPPGVHDHCDLHTTQGVLRLHDPRRFGAVVYAAHEDAPVAQKLLGKLGRRAARHSESRNEGGRHEDPDWIFAIDAGGCGRAGRDAG